MFHAPLSPSSTGHESIEEVPVQRANPEAPPSINPLEPGQNKTTVIEHVVENK